MLIIFDVEGTLINSRDLYYSKLKEGFDKIGTSLDLDADTCYHLRALPPLRKLEDFVRAYMNKGKELETLLKMPLNEAEEKAREWIAYAVSQDILDTVQKIYSNLNTEGENNISVRYIPAGRKALLMALKIRGHKLALVSNSSKESIEKDFADILDVFNVVISKEDLSNLKPSPEGINLALQKLHESSNNVLLLGDSKIDADTAKAAKVKFIPVLSGMAIKEWCEAMSDVVFKDANDLLTYKFE